jgi:hypothetical protein
VKNGDFDNTPCGCSALVGHDNAIHHDSGRRCSDEGGFRLICKADDVYEQLEPNALKKCPTGLEVGQGDCLKAGVALGQLLRNNVVQNGDWEHVPCGCSILISDNSIHYDYGGRCGIDSQIQFGLVCKRRVNECLLGTDACDANALCADTLGGYNCRCKSGYRGNGYYCNDIDECKIKGPGTSYCHADATCTNTPGSHICRCKNGYEGNGVSSCTDVDECKISSQGTSACHADATCTNTVGSYDCECKNGYEGNGESCEDVDECSQGTDTCNDDATCTNTPGGYTCECKPGYSGDGRSCTDIDECSEYVLLARNEADECPDGMEVDQASCASAGLALDNNLDDDDTVRENSWPDAPCGCFTYSPSKLIHYNLDSSTCRDDDRFPFQLICKKKTSACHADATCTNTVGSYNCKCNEGYGDGFTCSVFQIETSIGYNSLTMTIAEPLKNFPNADHYKVKAYKKGSATELLPVHSVHDTTIQQGANVSLTLENLEPGRRYTMNLTVFDKTGTEVYTTDNAMDSIAVTHCGCSDEEYQRFTVNEMTHGGNAEGSATLTGTPNNLIITQEGGDVMFSFSDDSRCEDGYAFTRDGLAFMPNYFYLAAEPCIATPISPRKKASDDLSDSKLAVYKYYTYCVRAVGKE